MGELLRQVRNEMGALAHMHGHDSVFALPLLKGVKAERIRLQTLSFGFAMVRDGLLDHVRPVDLRPFSKVTGKPSRSWRKAQRIADRFHNDRAAFNSSYRLISTVPQPDKVISKIMSKVLYQALEGRLPSGRQVLPVLHEHCYAYRQTRDGHGALSQLESWAWEQGYEWIGRTDIRSFFDRIRKETLESQLSETFERLGCPDPGFVKWLLALCFGERRLSWKVRHGNEERLFCDSRPIPSDVGVPQGNPLSSPLANLYLTGMDREMHGQGLAAGFRYLRYADDILICARSVDVVHGALEKFGCGCTSLGLELNVEKTSVDQIRSGKIVFMGFHYLAENQGKAVSDEKFMKLRTKLARATDPKLVRAHWDELPTKDQRLEYVIPAVNRRLLVKVPIDPEDSSKGERLSSHSFAMYYRHGREKAVLEQVRRLDSWIRRRIARFVEGPEGDDRECMKRFFNETLPDYNRRVSQRREGANLEERSRLKLVPLTRLMMQRLPRVTINQYGMEA
jgi:hypothetical protein